MPGIPPNAFDLVKNKLKGLMGKKKSKKTETAPAAGTSHQAAAAPHAPTKATETKPVTEQKAGVGAAAAAVGAATAPAVGATATGPSAPATGAALVAADTTPVVPELKNDSAPAPQSNTVAAAAPLPDLKDTTPANPASPASPTVQAEAEPSKTAETDPIHSVQPAQKSPEPIMAEPVTIHAPAAAPAPAATETEQKPAAENNAQVNEESVLAEPTKGPEQGELPLDIEPEQKSEINPKPKPTEEEINKNEEAKNASEKVEDVTAADPATGSKTSAPATAPSPAAAA